MQNLFSSQKNIPDHQSGLIPTLNRTGYMTSWLDEYSKAFVEFSSIIKEPVLEIGAAYGIATLEAVSRGATVIANDIDIRHLEIIKRLCPIELLSCSMRIPKFKQQ